MGMRFAPLVRLSTSLLYRDSSGPFLLGLIWVLGPVPHLVSPRLRVARDDCRVGGQVDNLIPCCDSAIP